MTDVRDLSLAHQRHLNSLQKKNKAELELINRKHEGYVRETKQTQESDIHNLRQAHQLELAEEVQKKEETLQALRQSQERTKRITESETERFKAHNERLRTEELDKNRNSLDVMARQHEEVVQDVNQRQNSTLKNLHEESQLRLSDADHRYRQNFADQSDSWKNKIENQRTHFAETFRAEGDKFDQMKDKQRAQNDKQVRATHLQHQTKLATINDQNIKFQEKLTDNHQKSLHEKETFFEKKYQDQLSRHNDSEKVLEDMHTKVVAEAKDSLNKRVGVLQDRSNDPFFTFTELRPEIEDKPDHYVLKVKVPEYAKEEVSLSVNQKEFVLTANRRYQDERKDADGSVKKVNKVESMVNRIPVSQVVNPKGMTKDWRDGMLYFNVKKA